MEHAKIALRFSLTNHLFESRNVESVAIFGSTNKLRRQYHVTRLVGPHWNGGCLLELICHSAAYILLNQELL